MPTYRTEYCQSNVSHEMHVRRNYNNVLKTLSFVKHLKTYLKQTHD